MISLIIRGDDLDLENVTRLLLVVPTSTRVKGQPLSKRPEAPIAKFSSWAVKLTSQETDEWDVSEAIRLLINCFPTKPGVWRQILATADARLSVGLRLETANQGFSLPSDILQFAADRNIDFDFDIYDRTMA